MLFAATLVLSVFLFTFCTQTVEDQKGEDAIENIDEILQQFLTVGLLHNEIMDDVLDDLKNQKQHLETRSQYFEFLEHSLLENLSEIELLIPIRKEETKKLVREHLSQINDPYSFAKSSENSFSDIASSGLNHMSPELSSLLQQVEDLINTASSNLDIVAGLHNINNNPVVQWLSFEEKHILYAVTAVGIESSLYWEDYLQIWFHTVLQYDLSRFDSVESFRFNGRAIIRGDVRGALVGAIGGCMTGALAGGVGCGPGAATGALIGSATYSAGVAIDQIVDHIF